MFKMLITAMIFTPLSSLSYMRPFGYLHIHVILSILHNDLLSMSVNLK